MPRWGNVEFWADGGAVHLLDLKRAPEKGGEAIKQVTPQELLRRARAVKESTSERWPGEVQQAQRLLSQATEVAQEAARQAAEISKRRKCQVRIP